MGMRSLFYSRNIFQRMGIKEGIRLKWKSLTEADLEDIPNTVKIVHDVAESHFGLGTRIAFLKACDDGEQGVLQIGEKGVGKTKSLEAIERLDILQGREVFTREFTMAGTTTEFNEIFTNNRVTWICKDLAKLSDIVRDNMLKVACSILTDNVCQVKTSMYDCNISNSRISWLGACTFEIFNEMWQSPLWIGNYMDRILRYFAFAFKRKDINPKVPIIKAVKNYDGKVEVKKDALFDELVDCLEWQFTSERSFEYASRLLTGMARCNKRRYTTEADAKFLLLHSFNIEAEAWVGYRDTITSPLIINSDPLYVFSEALKRNGVTVERIAYRRRCDEDVILNCLEEYNFLFKRIGKTIFAHPTIVKDEFKPQIDFEKFCLERGDEFFG